MRLPTFNLSRRPPGFVALVRQQGQFVAVHMTAEAGQRRLLNVATGKDGQATDIESLARQLPRRARALIGLGEKDYQLLQLDLPNVDAAELNEAVRFELKDRLDMPAEQASCAVIEIPSDPAAAYPRRSGYAVVSRRSELVSLMLACKHAKLELDTIDVPELLQHNYLKALGAEKAAAILSVLPQRTLLTIGTPDALCMVRQIDITASQLDSDNEQTRHAHFDRIVLEVQRTLDGFERQYGSWPLERLWLARFGDHDALLAHLIESLYLPVKPLLLSELFRSDLDLSEPQRAHDCFLPLGLALRGFESTP